MKKLISLVLALTLFGCGVNKPNIAPAQSKNIENIIRDTKLLGEVGRSINPKSDKLVYLIPDKHSKVGNVEIPENESYQENVLLTMVHLAENYGVKMIGTEGNLIGEIDGSGISLPESNSEKEYVLSEIFKKHAPHALEILDPEYFHTYGIEDSTLINKAMKLNDRMLSMFEKDSTQTDEFSEIYGDFLRNAQQRSNASIKNLLEEMDSKGYKSTMVPFGADHLQDMKYELVKKGVSLIEIDPEKFVQEQYGGKNEKK